MDDNNLVVLRIIRCPLARERIHARVTGLIAMAVFVGAVMWMAMSELAR